MFMYVDKAGDIAAGLQPPSSPTPFLRKTWYCDGAEDERGKMGRATMKMAMAKPLAFGRAGGPGPHPTQVGFMAKPATIFLFTIVFKIFPLISVCSEYE